MNPSFDTKAMCKILASYCNKQNHFGTECPAGGHYLCPFMQEDFGKPCFDMTWKDWRDFFKDDGKHDEDK